MKYLGFIPARSGSKGIPNKGMQIIGDKTLIGHTFDATKNSKINEIFFSTDSKSYMEEAAKYDIHCEYLRPPHLAQDETGMLEVVCHGLDYLKEKGKKPENIILLQPTSPLRTSKHINEAIEKFESNDATSLTSVHELLEHPWESTQGGESNWKYLSTPDENIKHRQGYRNDFTYINGAIYIVNTDWFLKNKCFVVEGETLLYLMDPVYGVDVDEPIDLVKARAYYNYLIEEKNEKSFG